MLYEEKPIKSETIYDGRIIKVKVETVELPDMKYAKREVVEHAPSVAILAISERNTIYMVRQYRIGAKEETLELPAGLVDPGENPQDTAIRELQEEIHLKPKKLEYLLDTYSSPGFCNEKVSLFVARDFEPSILDRDSTEFLEIEEYTIEELYKMVLNFEILDAITIIGIFYAYNHLRKTNDA